MPALRLIDPESHEPLSEATDEAIAKLTSLVSQGRARQADGRPVAPFEGAYLPPSRDRAYPIRGGIPSFLLEERLELDEALP